MQLKNMVALITGGGSGLGGATAQEFAAAGAKVVILDLPGSPGPKLAETFGGNGLFVAANVADAAATEQAINAAVARFNALHCAVNCAGIGRAHRTIGKEGPHPLELFNQVVQVNLVGTFNVIRLAAAQMAKNAPGPDGERGVIINTASIAAYDGQIGQAAYSASKGGVVGMTLPIARDLASSGIRVCTIAPGTFDTPMLATLPEAARKALGAQVPFPSRLGQPEEFAALARHIVENAMLNGETIRLDGALRMAPR
ncbi:MAG TPA: SDR family NAD(P)-dependent oxidoreductase [Candidatus Binataceae bacterium]|nr:SDR family NAD(P)-dependent oxidoreductase [Candidatus Binataceae bacterium]